MMKFTDNPGAKVIFLLHTSHENIFSVSCAQAKRRATISLRSLGQKKNEIVVKHMEIRTY